MLLVPAATGSTVLVRDHGWRWAALPVLAITLVGYLLLNATTLWLKSRRKARYLPPVRAYAAATAVLGLVTLLLAPALAGWLALAAPLVGVALLLAARRQDRALASGLVTVTTACLVTPVLWSAGLAGRAPLGALTAVGDAVRDPGLRRATGVLALTTVAQLAYFVGTVAYVKTMIRERGDRGWLVGSVAYHAVCTVALLAAALLGLPSLVHPLARWGLVALLGLATARAALMPLLGARPGRTITPMQVGLLELGFSATLLACCLAL